MNNRETIQELADLFIGGGFECETPEEEQMLMKSTYLHALYAIVAEVSYYLSGFSKEINRDYLINTKEISKFYINRDVDIIIKELLKAAGIDEEGLPDKI